MTQKYFENNNDTKFLYQMLDRLESDCKYFLGNGNELEDYLWAKKVKNQISAMK